jgi:hypothetical protein
MQFNRAQLIGITSTIVGFIIVGVAGVTLATQVTRPGADVGGVLLQALIAFLFAAPFIGYGIFSYVLNSESDDDTATDSDVNLQLRIVDFVRNKGMATFDEVAQELELDEATVRDLVADLLRLRIFGGVVDWNAGVLYAKNATQLADGTPNNDPIT